MEKRFKNRSEAGKFLGQKLVEHVQGADVLVLALPRGGVPVGLEISRILEAPLDIFLVRKLSLPGHGDLAMGAIATGSVRTLNQSVVRAFGISQHVIDTATERAEAQLRHEERLYRGDRPGHVVRGKTVVLVDDGLAAGSNMRAAISAIRQQHPARIILAVPVAAPEACQEIRSEVDELICGRMPDPFMAAGLWYRDFSPVTDEEAQQSLERAAKYQLAGAHH